MFAFVVLILTTHNIYVAVLNVLTIAGVLASIIGMIYMWGWRLGVTESLGMDLFVGFSVDYIVHVGHQYAESIYETRQDRMNHAYKHIGLAVISGCATTFISATFMIFTKIYVLRKFGILLQATLLLSIYFSLIFFPAMCYIVGP